MTKIWIDPLIGPTLSTGTASPSKAANLTNPALALEEPTTIQNSWRPRIRSMIISNIELVWSPTSQPKPESNITIETCSNI